MCDNSRPSNNNDTRPVALVDFCGTVVSFPTAVAFTRFVAREMPTRHARRTDRFITLLHRLRITGLVRHLFPSLSFVKRLNLYKLRGYSRDDINALAARFYHEEIEPHLVAPVIDKLHDLQERGYRLCIVSGAIDVYVNIFAAAMGIDDVLCTHLAFDDRGMCTGRIAGRDCMGRRKVKAVTRHLGVASFPCPGWIALSDERDDLPLLRLAEHPIVISHAHEQTWATRLALPQIIYP